MSEPTPAPASNLVGAFFAGLILIPLTAGALGVKTNGATVLWFLGGVVAVVLFGLLLRLVIPQGLALSMAATGIAVILILLGLLLVAGLGDPPSDGVIALLVGIPAAAIAAVGSAVVVQRAGDAAHPVAGGVMAVLFVIGLAIANPIGAKVNEARGDAVWLEALEKTSISPYLPEIGSLSTRFSGTRSVDDKVVGARLHYQADDQHVADSFLSVEIATELSASNSCDAREQIVYECREEDGYYVLEDDGVVTAIVADHGGTYLVASYISEQGDLPDPDTIGDALADAELVEWDEIVSLD